MKSKRKLLISLLTVSFVLLSVVATVAIAFALTQHTITTTLNIGYTVEDIDGSVRASYTIGTSTEQLTAMKGSEAQGNTLYFRAGDTENAGNLVFPEGELPLTAQNDNIVIQYTYANTGDKHYIASMDFDAELISENMTVEYSIDGITYSEDRYAVVVPANTPERSYWIRISITNKAKSASFKGDFNWFLNACDEQEDSYLSLTSLEFQGSDGAYSASVSSTGEYTGQIIFPSSVNNDPVTTIYANSLTQAQKDQVKSVYIPDSVTKVGSSAFESFTNLETVTFEQNESAGSASVQSETGLTVFGARAFYNCKSLKEVNIPSTLIEIGTFHSEYGMIDGEVFANCTNLKNVFLPKSVQKIAIGSFSGCTSLTNVEFEEESALNDLSGYVFQNCSSLTELNIPNGVETLYNGFIKGTQISVFIMPANVTFVNDGAFEGADMLSLIIDNRSSKVKPGECGLPEYAGVISVEGDISPEDYYYTDSQGLRYVMCEEGKCQITAYLGNKKNNIVIPSQINGWEVTRIVRNYLFDGCEIGYVYIPSTVTYMRAYLFTSETVVYYGNDSIDTSICSEYWNQCGLIGPLPTFYGCSYEDFLLDIGKGKQLENANPGFNYTGSVLMEYTLTETDVVVPEGTTMVYQRFMDNQALTSIILPSTLTNILYLQFSNCVNLKSVFIPKSVQKIDFAAFFSCNANLVIYCEVAEYQSEWGSNVFADLINSAEYTIKYGYDLQEYLSETNG